MKRILLATAAARLLASAAAAQDAVNVGIILGFTGPLESITPGMAASAELAFKEATDSGKLPGGMTLNPVRADSTCIDAAAATTAATNLVTGENVAAIMGADCSGVTTAIANNVAVPNGVVMISPSATSPALSTIEDNGFFFRTAPSDARQGEILADVVKEQGIDNVAVTYTNNDYGKGLADAFAAAFKALGGTVAITAAARGRQGRLFGRGRGAAGLGRRRRSSCSATSTRAASASSRPRSTPAPSSSFFFGDGMYGQSLIDAIGDELDGKVIGTLPGSEGEGADKFAARRRGRRLGPDRHLRARELRRRGADRARRSPPAGSADRTAIRDKVMDVANAPGRADLRGRARQGPRARRRRHRHRLCRRHRRRADRPGRGRGHLPRVRDRGQRRRSRSAIR